MADSKSTKIAGALIGGVTAMGGLLGGPAVPPASTQSVEAQARQSQAQIARDLRNGGRKPGQTGGK
ncbi:hypothetical protein [Pseudoclavibacter helvolus]|uniref:hypothetical protein n=1 Tax=Pseudoclavibacter helvolus TaxID=255205 RepID=UPI003C71BB77